MMFLKTEAPRCLNDLIAEYTTKELDQQKQRWRRFAGEKILSWNQKEVLVAIQSRTLSESWEQGNITNPEGRNLGFNSQTVKIKLTQAKMLSSQPGNSKTG